MSELASRDFVAVGLVDDNEWRRRGIRSGVEELGGVLRVTLATSTDLVEASGELGACDVVLIHIDSGAGWDAYEGVGVVAAVSRLVGTGTALLVVSPPHASPLLRLRVLEAGARHLYSSDDLSTIARLEGALLVPDRDRHRQWGLDPQLLHRLGLGSTSRLNSGLAFVIEQGLADVLRAPHATMSRREAISMRRRLASVIGMRPVSTASGSLTEPRVPSWRQLAQVIDLARGATSRAAARSPSARPQQVRTAGSTNGVPVRLPDV